MNLFKKFLNREYKEEHVSAIENVVMEKPNKQSKKEIEIIEEIHNSFETASYRLLEEAKSIIANKIPNEKAEKMAKLGFTNAKGVQENIEIKRERQEQEKIALKLEYYNNKYPLYKFITEKEIEKICNKYNLVFGEARLYKGDIPEKNIKEISNFVQPKEEDLCYKKTESWGIGADITNINYEEYKRQKDSTNYSSHYRAYYSVDTRFSICAPVSDMHTTGYKKEGYKLVAVPDPIVLFPVADNMYVVVSKWGLEANDELLINSIEN